MAKKPAPLWWETEMSNLKFDPRIKETPDLPGELYDEDFYQQCQAEKGRDEMLAYKKQLLAGLSSHEAKTERRKCCDCGATADHEAGINVEERPENGEVYCDECWSEICLDAYWEVGRLLDEAEEEE